MRNEQDRLTELERLAAEQERVIAELSDQIAQQWRIIDGQTKQLERLVRRLDDLEDLSTPDAPVTRPPHW